MPRNDTDRKRPQRAETGAEYYELHTQAVKDLAEASVENTPHYSEEELNRYRGKSRIRLPGAVKALLVKLWFNGADLTSQLSLASTDAEGRKVYTASFASADVMSQLGTDGAWVVLFMDKNKNYDLNGDGQVTIADVTMLVDVILAR